MTKYSGFLDEDFREKLTEFRENRDGKIFAKENLREAFGAGILAEVEKNPKVLALSADLSESVGLKNFREKLPENYVEVGIAEQNLVSVAAGLAHVGFRPFAMSYAAFNPGRNYEQIRTNIALNDVPVVLVGTHVGLSVGSDGATHQMTEDISLMRAMPKMSVFAPADANEALALAEFLASEKWQKPAYVRLPREGVPTIFRERKFAKIEDFLPEILLKNEEEFSKNSGQKIAIFATGNSTIEALKAAEILAGKNINASVIHFPAIKISDENFAKKLEEKLIDFAKKYDTILTVEDHQIAGGFGSMIAEILVENFAKISRKNDEKFYKINFTRIGLDDEFGQSGTAEELAKHYGIDAENIAKKAEKISRN
jgi:transketolase